MKAWLLLLVSLLLTSTSFAFEDAPVQRVLADSAGVLNMESFALADIANKPGTWILATMSPGPRSGHYLMNSFFINGATGKFVKHPGGVDGVNVEGTLNILGTLKGTPPAKSVYSYQWLIPSPIGFINGVGREKVSPWAFRNSHALIVLRFSEDLSDPSRLLPILDVPEAWRDFVLPAWRYYQAHPGLFDVQAVAHNREHLQKLWLGENPILAAAAGQALAETDGGGEGLVIPPLAGSSELRQAVATHLLLKYEPQSLGEAAVEDVGEVVDAAQRAEDFKGIALGALVALREKDHRTSLLGFRLLERVEKKQGTLGYKSEADKSVWAILRSASLAMLRQNAAFMRQDPPQATQAATK